MSGMVIAMTLLQMLWVIDDTWYLVRLFRAPPPHTPLLPLFASPCPHPHTNRTWFHSLRFADPLFCTVHICRVCSLHLALTCVLITPLLCSPKWCYVGGECDTTSPTPCIPCQKRCRAVTTGLSSRHSEQACHPHDSSCKSSNTTISKPSCIDQVAPMGPRKFELFFKFAKKQTMKLAQIT